MEEVGERVRKAEKRGAGGEREVKEDYTWQEEEEEEEEEEYKRRTDRRQYNNNFV